MVWNKCEVTAFEPVVWQTDRRRMGCSGVQAKQVGKSTVIPQLWG